MRKVGFATILFLIYLLPVLFAFKVLSTNTFLRCRNRPKDLRKPSKFTNILINCHRKIRIEMKIENNAKSEEEKEYFMINTVRDPKTNSTKRLLNPIALQIRQETLSLAYPFHYLSGVNGKAREIVVTKETSTNYTGCDVRSKTHSICGTKHHNGQPIRYSRGFCCFCKDSGIHKRGGQKCDRKNIPNNIKSTNLYLASTHCLVFDRLWYVVSSISRPTIFHFVYFHAYIRRETPNGESVWWDFNEKEEIIVGKQIPRAKNNKGTLIVGFIPQLIPRRYITINVKRQRLLIPLETPELAKKEVPEIIKNGAENYLLVSKDMINVSGKQCDTIGVSYEAFYKQKNRCENPRNSCLRNQPLDLWTSDNDKRINGRNGSHLLLFYGKPHKEPILQNKTSGEHWLIMELPKQMTSSYYIEMDAQNITVLSPGRFAQIDAIVIENVKIEGNVMLTVFITNLGLASAKFRIKAVHCSDGIQNSRATISIIPPQYTKNVTIPIKLNRANIIERATCEVEVRTKRYGRIAVRKALIMPGRHCFCYYYCRCDCSDNFNCESMTQKQFHLAGFKGSLPILHLKPPNPYWFENHVIASLIIIVLVFLILGLLKAIIGETLSLTIGRFGLGGCLFRKKKLMHYYEPELKDARVIYKDGYAINPDTKEPARAISYETEAMLNILFFLIWPALFLYYAVLMIVNRRDKYKQVFEADDMETTTQDEKRHLIDKLSRPNVLFNTFLVRGYISAKIELANQIQKFH